MKLKRIATFFVCLLMLFTSMTIVNPLTVSANIPAANRAVIFVRMVNQNWQGITHATTGSWMEFDITQERAHTLTLPAWPQNTTNWINNGNTGVFLLRPSGVATATPVIIESISVAGQPRITNQAFGTGHFWNQTAGQFFGGISVPSGEVHNIPAHNLTVQNFLVEDINPTITIDEWSSAGPSPSLGTINQNQIMTVTFRVGGNNNTMLRPYGDIDNDGVINSADVTWLRRYLALTPANRLTFATQHNLPIRNMNVLGTGEVNNNSLSLLRRYVAGGDVWLGPEEEEDNHGPIDGWFIAITTDDGPMAPFTGRMLDVLETLNARPNVVCGMNGPLPCVTGRRGRYGNCTRGGGAACGTQSRAHISFYVSGQQNRLTPANSRTTLRRMLEQGHSVENHTLNHNISRDWTQAQVINDITATNTLIRTSLHGASSVTDFYGNTWSDSNPYPIFSYRPNNFTMGTNFRGADEQTNMPWIFASLDTGDWISAHTAPMMVDWLLNGQFVGSGAYSPTNRRCPCTETWCSLRTSGGTGAANGNHRGGIVLIHDTKQSVVDFVEQVVPQMQTMGYHFVTIEQMFTYMDAEWAWINNVTTIRPGAGYGTRVNDIVIRGARRAGPIRPSTRP
jgi:peptidoglycan/xylan/chitin deacetylase (PgdA/CDA1 family)